MNYIRLNTALKPPTNISDKVIVLSKEIASDNEPVFVLDGLDFHPHITVYSPEYPEERIEEVFKGAEATAQANERVSLKFLRGTSKQGYIGIKFEPTEEIQKLHEDLVSKLNPFRGGHIRDKYREDGSDYNMEFTDEQKENIKQYGYPDAMTLYKPHMTIIRIKDEGRALEIADSLEWDVGEFTVNKLGVYAMGKNGACKELLKEVSLTG